MWEGRKLLGTIFVRWRRKHFTKFWIPFYIVMV